MPTTLSMNTLAPAVGVLGDVLRAAAQHPRRTAVIDNGRAMSYAELAGRVQMTATQLGPRCCLTARRAMSTARPCGLAT
jgi:non-ribosomal peptide synthetase component E (peptide arylation enzyme)